MTSEHYRAHLAKLSSVMGIEVTEIALPQDRAVNLGGMLFHYLDWGDPASPAILFLHGGGQTKHTWDLCCVALQSRYRCLALDQRGHGDSAWSDEMAYSIDAHRQDIDRFVNSCGLARLALVGMSMGGINALAYAVTNSQRLAGLVLVDVGPDVQFAGAERAVSFATQGPAEFANVDAAVERALQFNPNRDRELLRTGLLHNLRQLPNGRWTWKYDRRQFERVTVEELLAERKPLWNELHRVTCPTLIVRGGRSPVFHDEDAERLARALPQGEWTKAEGAGHSVQGDNPKALAAAIAEFLSRP